MPSKFQLLPLVLFFVAVTPSFAQSCGCNQCNVPIVADYSRDYLFKVSGATFNNLGTPEQGVCEVEIDFSHDFISDLTIDLVSPGGNTVRLVQDINPNDTTYNSRWTIKYKPCAEPVNPDPGFQAIFSDNFNWPKNSTLTGSYYPSTGCLEQFNQGPVNGTWLLKVSSVGFRGVGFIHGFKVLFCQNQGIQCTGLLYSPIPGDDSGEDCQSAAQLPTDINTYIGNTMPFVAGFAPGFCGTIENDQWFTFVSNCDIVTFTITPGYCINGDGIQLALYEDCNSSPIACQGGCMDCGWQSLTITQPVTPGNQYYILIDGFAGDQCDFEFTYPPGCVGDLEDPDPNDVDLVGCSGSSFWVGLSEIPFGAAGYIWKATNGALVNGKTQDTIVGPENLNVKLTFGDEDGQICVAAYNYTSVSNFVCLDFTVKPPLELVENAMVCYDELPFYSEYVAFGVPSVGAAGTYTFPLYNYPDEFGVPYPCPVTLTLNLQVEGSFSPLPNVVALGTSYLLPNGDLVSSSGQYFWSESLPSGCTNDHTQGIYLIDWIYNTDHCLPDTVTFIMPGGGVVLSCPGGVPAVLVGPGAKKVVYHNAGDYDLIGQIGTLSFPFNDTLHIDSEVQPVAGFSKSVVLNVVTFNNLSQGASGYLWDFGDGATSTEANPTHTYTAPGNYLVKLTAMNTCSSAMTMLVVIGGELPQAAFQVSPATGCAPLEVVYTDHSLGSPTSWAWTFPGGNPAFSTEQNPIVTYDTPGTYTASLSIQNEFGESVFSQSTAVVVSTGIVADFSWTVSQNQLVLTNLSQNASSYLWDFGDGFTSTEANPTHTYASAGTYTVLMVATGPCGIQTSVQVIQVVGEAPVAAFDIGQNAGCVPFVVQFQDLSTGNPSAWQWSFPGGLPSVSSDQNPVVIYIDPGVFDVSLTVQNAYGAHTASQAAFVSTSPLPTVLYTFSTAGLQAVFANQSQGADTYLWDFGDGATSVETAPTHAFALPGNYLVVLQATNTCGTSILQQWVEVTTTGLASAERLAWLRAFPNPSSGQFALELRDEPSSYLSWRFYNALGQNIAQRNLNEFAGQYMEELDFSHLPPAVYWLEVRTAEKRSWLRIVLE